MNIDVFFFRWRFNYDLNTAGLSSNLNKEKNTNRSDPTTMHNIDQIPLARLRPEKFDDAAIQKQILLIRDACENINLDVIAVVFHECDYNIQNTIARIKAGDFEDGGWQTAKSNNKKKTINNSHVDQTLNGSAQSDSEHSPSQHTSPAPSLRDSGRRRRRQDHYRHSLASRGYPTRRGNAPSRNQYIPYHSSRNYPNTSETKQQNANNEKTSVSKTKDDIIPPPSASVSTDEFEFIDGTTPTLKFDNSHKKSSLPLSTKRPIPSSIPQEPVSMHSIIKCPRGPIDIQFGDVQWNDSVPIAVSPSDSSILAESLDDQKSSSVINTNDDEQQIDAQDNLIETTNRLSSCSISSSSLSLANNTRANNSASLSLERTSHLSDQLTGSLQQQVPLETTTSFADTTQLPPISTINTLEYSSQTSQNTNTFVPNNFQLPLSNASAVSGGSQSAFTPYNTAGTYSPTQRDYSQTPWNQQQQANYKAAAKATLMQQGNYPHKTSYPMQHQQQYFVGTYPYAPTPLYPYLTPVDSWSTASLEPYSTYPTAANYMQSYPTQQSYHPTNIQSNRYDRSSNEKDFFAYYGQTRILNSDLSTSSQTTKDTPITSKLSATAASFSQGASLTAASPTTTLYFNPVLYTVPTYYTSHHDRNMNYPSVDNRDNRNGASYAAHNNRNHYHHQQQRTHNNSMWHSQQ
ncbi:unnamed protein product [Rotaria magnacalcarata]|uniref:Uncharacterized protein n=1 Tax=Rotaria magnacalcarata TaxID=392030 RepID=A0A816MJ91_9BILA|nr:unnamed protein product [Rotaria magnacalcarata]CAF1683359.1 unnamed protein product [Rotaria magnacalcarata]CAF1999715.1 unnamed protein product [Rotaria magnacalcarata]CAF2012867.1 unnamed protein product [Rotaria magnacalcarata]